MTKTVTIIDTFGFFFRSFYALPQHLQNKDGFPTGLLTGFTNFISNLQKQHDSDYIVFAIDTKGSTFRNDIDKNYKANRQPPPEELTMQLPLAIDWIDKMGYKTLGKVGFEADDVIATITKIAKEKNYKVRVVSHDKDLYQLIDDEKVIIIDAVKNIKMNEEACFKKYGVYPNQFIDYQSILGDTADNIPGVRGIGKVGAEKLLKEYKTLDMIYKNIGTIKPLGMQKKLVASKENATMSKKLVTLRDDIFEDFDFEKYKMDIKNPFLNIYDELVKYEQNAVLRMLHAKNMVSEEDKKNAILKVNKEMQKNRKIDFNSILITKPNHLYEILGSIKSGSIVAFDTETTGLNYEKDKLVGFSFCFDLKNAYYVPIAHSYLNVPMQMGILDAQIAIEKIFKHRVVGHNIKFDMHFVSRFLKLDTLDIFSDTMILAWLTNTEIALGLDKLADKLLNHKMLSYKETVQKGETFASVNLNQACEYASEDAFICLHLYKILLEKLSLQNAKHLEKELDDVEIPFIKILLSMEKNGIELDSVFLDTFGDEVRQNLKHLTKNIHELAGSQFNINSTKQLGIVLFETLELQSSKKTKTGYSTDEKVLRSLENSHQIIPLIQEYREVHKLLSAYIEPLLKLSRDDVQNRIHTSFIQTGTATGRLSSKNPNLQNIPVRTKLGAKIRKAFVAGKGKKLIGIDYSQIELRLLAHFSKDDVLLKAFIDDKDIHMQTAIILFGKDKADNKRHIAKTVNFGLLYGMGPKKLSETLEITTKEAQEIIEKYFEGFPTVKRFFRSIADGSREFGFVETLLKRRRYFDYKNASPMFQAAYERESINSIFQGSASDLIKLSMNKIYKIIQEENLNAKILLQIHDELIFEVDETQAQELGERFKSMMENIFELNIPLKASINIGDNWGELK